MEILSSYSNNIYAFLIFNLVVIAFLAMDLGIFHRESKEVTYKESAAWTAIWVIISLIFSGWLYVDQSPDISFLFLTGYAIEKSLSIDNVMVFAIIFSSLQIPLKYQHRILFWGILGALLMRALMIMLGYKLIQEYHFVIYIFGAFLILTGAKILLLKENDNAIQDGWLWKTIHKFIPLTSTLDGEHFVTKRTDASGRVVRVGTPLLTALILVELSDVIFAVDSIPAIFAITKDPFIVYTSNVFAILGLRSLYFMIGAAMNDFKYLKPAIALILIMVGVKMLKIISLTPPQSLLMIVGILVVGVVASLRHRRNNKA